MDKFDVGVIGLYVVTISLITLFTFKPQWSSIFQASKKTKWWISGLSLFMIIMSTDGPQLITGIVYNYGIKGLWILWVGTLTVGVVPIIFAPLWSKLNLPTDNQFLLLRFSGKSAKVLFNFRAIYLGAVIVPLLLSFQLIAFQNVLIRYFELTPGGALLITTITILFFALKNSFDHKLKTDVLHAVIYLVAFLSASIILVNKGEGWANVLTTFNKIYPNKLDILPNFSNDAFQSEFLIYLFVLWWSAQMFDGSGAEMHRFTALKGRYRVIAAALLPIAMKQLFFMIILVIIISGMVVNSDSLTEQNHEASFIYFFTQNMPIGLKGVSLVGFFVAFITTTEALLNWGSSLLVLDIYKRNMTIKSDAHYVRVSIIVMGLMVFLALGFAYFNNSLYGLLQIFLSLSAGVAPVFILRWVWLRINAWSQLSAMLGSLFYTYIFSLLRVDWLTTIGMYDKTARVLFVTVLTTITWLLITFLTQKDDASLLREFRTKVPLTYFSWKRISLALLVGIITILVMILSVKLLLSY